MLARVLLTVILALIVGIGAMLLLTNGRAGLDPAPVRGAPQPSAELDALRDERDRLQARVRELAALAAPARVPVAGDEGQSERVRVLEQELDALRARLAALERAEPQGADEIATAIEMLDPNNADGIRVRMARRIALLERFLEQYPSDPRSGDFLAELSGQYLQSGQAPESLRVLEQYSEKVGLRGWKRDELLANALHFNDRTDEADQAYQRVANDPDAPEWRRWNARFFAAYMYMRTGKYDEARRRFEAIVADAGADPGPELRQTVDGAKEQLRQIEALTGDH